MKKQNNQKLKIGILGGMGPQAGAELVRLIIAKAISRGAVDCDQFPEIILDSVPVPDFIATRTNLAKVSRMLSARAKTLRKLGCNPVAMACNTAHLMENDVKRAAGPAFRSMIVTIGNEAKKRRMKRVIVLASPLTIKTDLYKKSLGQIGVEVINPDRKNQIRLEDIIRRVIAGGSGSALRRQVLEMAAKEMKAQKADGVILGCTELPVATGLVRNRKIINSLEVLAENVFENKEASV